MAEFHYFSGTTKWAKLRKPDEKYKRWSLPLYVNKATKQAIKAAGIGLQFKQDDEGNEYVTFSRPMAKEMKGELVQFDPPKVYLGKEPFSGIVGNGSTVTVKVVVYDTPKGPGHRLEAVRVDDLVPYEMPEREDAF